jgi:hypothetical protein
VLGAYFIKAGPMPHKHTTVAARGHSITIFGGFERLSPHDSPGDECYDILSKLSVSSLHQIEHIRVSGARPPSQRWLG